MRAPAVRLRIHPDADDADTLEDNADVEDSAAAREARAVAAFSTDARVAFAANKEYIKEASILLRQAYIKVPQKYIATFLPKHKNCLLPALLAFETMITTEQLPYKEKVRGTVVIKEYTPSQLPDTIRTAKPGIIKNVLQEYELALRLRDVRRFWRTVADRRVLDEAANYAQAERDGAIQECECCCADMPINRMVHCDNAQATHFFCKDCARRMAETQVGLFKYHLTCMSMDSCEAGFSHDQRRLFLSKKTTRALEHIEQDHVLRVAGLEGLERCPFCPFAAEYPPVEVNKEFACQNPGCEAVTCRLCQKDTHIPKTCEEAERERGDQPSARLLVEEAMSMAMIRSCNKCTTPFIKEHGCNKMTCTNAGCGNVQCYVCHMSCDYSHFDDTTRGGKKGNCPLFESAEKRHEEEVQAAEARAREEVAKKNPGLDMSTLQFDLSDKVLDDERRRRNDDQAHIVGRA
ncbi:ring finger protein [Ophiostoma piceae UAMH 11346]|uniref:Ring finger protein n=1 Tax=Ophiostoma piceae (strain UAMH 11346) TaxID=1262450 RepID=S3CSH1_OPHP1|nr:ring finger protein [Ophiostoma piceae UAMH 11346]